jgi:hypothetical protein
MILTFIAKTMGEIGLNPKPIFSGFEAAHAQIYLCSLNAITSKSSPQRAQL